MPLPHLSDAMHRAQGCFAIDFQVLLSTPKMRTDGAAPHLRSRSNAAMRTNQRRRWSHNTPGTAATCNPVVSVREPGTEGCLLEMTRGGRSQIALPNGETGTYLLDGDEVIFRRTAREDGAVSIGFGECPGTVTEALALR